MSARGGDDLFAELAAVWEANAANMRARLDAIDVAATALLGGSLDDERRAAARTAAHKLAGSLGTFGLARGSELAAELEEMLRGTGAVPALRMSELAGLLRGIADAGPVKAIEHSRVPLDVLIVDASRQRGAALVAAAARSGIAAQSVADVKLVGAQLAATAPVVALVDAETPGWRDLIADLADRTPPIAIAVRLAEEALPDRVAIAALGVRIALARDMPTRAVIDALRGLLDLHRADAPRVLAIDDDPVVLDALQQSFGSLGVVVTTVDDPGLFWGVLDQIAPDAVLLDVDMPQLDGIVLCRTIRSDPRWARLPVIFLSARGDPDTIRRAYAAGADDYLVKPLTPSDLGMRLQNRLVRVRALRAIGEVDVLTGISSRRRSDELLERFRRLAEQSASSLAIALIDLDDFKAVNDTRGHAAGDLVLRHVGALLRSAFRQQDVIGRWGGDEFVVAMLGMGRSEAAERIGALLESLRTASLIDEQGAAIEVRASVGLAVYPEDGADISAVVRAADADLYVAKGWEPDRAAGAARLAEPGATASVTDVIVIDDDAVLSDLVRHALQTRGYTVRVIPDGRAAVDALTGPSPLRARLLLLDVDLPGLDGFAVLRRLGEAGVTRTTPTIMLTVRATEREILEALESGAADHVAKPFSIPILMQRISLALRR